MEWNVKNAINRDVERQHLNKILQEIGVAIADLSIKARDSNEGLSIQDIVGQMVENNVETGITVDYDLVNQVLNFTIANFVIRLLGDVTGSAEVNGLNSVTIQTTLDPSLIGVPEAPMDSDAYWRRSGEWEHVGYNIERIRNLAGVGFPAMDVNAFWNLREFEAAADELTVTNADGSSGNVLYGLADVTPVAGGTMKTLTFDDKGRRIEEDEADTDDLPEGVLNLYFTDERAQDAVGSILEDTADIEFTYDDATPEITAELSTAVHDSLDLADSAVQSVVAGTNITVDNTDPQNPIVSAAGGGGGGTVTSVAVSGTDGIEVDSGSPVTTSGTIQLGLSATVLGQLADAATAVQPGDLATVATTGDYDDLINLPTLGTMAAEDAADYTPTSGLAAVALSNDYNDLDNLPSIPSGTVTSVALSVPTGLVVAGSPITTSGTFTVTYDTGYQGYTTTEASKLAGIEAGAEVNTVDSVNTQTGAVVLDFADVGAEEAFSKGSLVQGSGVTLTGTLTDRLVGSGNVTIAAAGGGGGQVDSITAADSTLVVDSTDPVNPTVRITHIPTNTIVGRNDVGTGTIEALTPAEVRALINVADGATANTGTVTSVGMTVPTGLGVTGSPITGSGTLALSWSLEAPNYVFAGPSAGGAATPTFRALLPVDIPTLDSSKISDVGSGTYTPTGTGILNVASVTSDVAQYMRVGNVATVSGRVTVTTSAAGNTVFRLSLPVASVIASQTQVSGVMSSAAGVAGRIFANVANNIAQLQFTAPGTAATDYSYTYTYLIN